jgi:hypothetical protein
MSGVALVYGLNDWGFEFWQGLGISLFTTMSRPTLELTQLPIQRGPGTFSLGVKQLGHGADHSLPPSAKVKNAWSCTFTPTICLHGVVLSWKKKQGDSFTFTFTFTIKSHCTYLFAFVVYVRKNESFWILQVFIVGGVETHSLQSI